MTITPQARIALVAFSSLGDGLIYLLMAENLRLNGFAVTYFGNIGYQLRAWLPQFEIRPYPAKDQMEAALADFDLVIMSPPQFMRDHMDQESTDEMRRKWLLICQQAPVDWRFDLSESKQATLPPTTFAALRGLLDCGGPIRQRKYATESVVDITLEYMRTRMGLIKLTRHVELTPPPALQLRRYPKRIIISPDSAWPEKKDWPPSAFIRLCRQLKAQGDDPKIVVAPAKHEFWKKIINQEFDTPVFPDIGDLAAYLYESGALIANDSGNGHLASFLGLPVVTIYRKKNRHFHWRPDWSPGQVVCPRLVLPGWRGSIWKPFVLVADVLSALKSLR